MKENNEVLKDNDISLFHKSTNKNSQKNSIDDSMENDINFSTQYHSSNNEKKFDQKLINDYIKSKSESYLKKKIQRNVIENQEENEYESLFSEDKFKIPKASYNDLFNDSPPFNNTFFEYENKNQCLFEFDSNPSEYLINNNNIDNINNINNNNNINLLFQFNYKRYKQNYYKNYINYIFIEPDIIPLEYIINNDNNKPMIKTLSYIIDISFENENDLIKIQNGIIFENLWNFLTNSKNQENIIFKYNIRKFMPDLMSSVFKIFCSNVILDGVNSFEEIEKNKLKKIDNDLINNKIKGDFNLTYFVQFLYSILSNDSKYKNNNIEKIQNIFNSNKTDKKHLELIEFLKLKVIDIINIIRYNNNDKLVKLKKNF